ncbi:MAG: hypothetical protein ACPG8W_18905 [Candidatus Promineifilaceae bacterium]
MRSTLYQSFLTVLVLLAFVPTAWAHGTNIGVTVDGSTVQIEARFETGEPMSEAQIIVYTPNDPETPWLSGAADVEGAYSFDVDTTLVGEWAVTIRTGGHGEIVHLNVNRNGTIQVDQPSERNPIVTAIVAGVVVAGLGGVAYYFNQKQ